MCVEQNMKNIRFDVMRLDIIRFTWTHKYIIEYVSMRTVYH